MQPHPQLELVTQQFSQTSISSKEDEATEELDLLEPSSVEKIVQNEDTSKKDSASSSSSNFVDRISKKVIFLRKMIAKVLN